MKKFILTLFIAILSVFCVIPVICPNNYSAQSAPAYKKVRVQVIVVNTKSEADTIKKQLDSGASFYALAKKYSIVSTSEKGGDCGYLEKNEIDKEYPEFSQLAQSAPIGYITQPTKTKDGWSIAKLLSRSY